MSGNRKGRRAKGESTEPDETLRRRREEADLAALTRMHALSARPLGAGGLDPLLQEIMDVAVAIVGAERGTLQLIEGDSLRIVAHHGHQLPFLEFFARAEARASVCGEAMKHGQRVIVEDVEHSPLFAGTASLQVLRDAGVRAVQSTPLLTRQGKLLGILTTQWAVPHVPDEHALWRIDLLARQGADLIEHEQVQEAALRSQRTFSELVERAPFGIYVVDSRFRIAQMNVGSQNGAFRNVRPVLGRDFSEAMRILWPEPVAVGIIAVFRHTLETGEPYYSPRFVNPRHDVETVEAYEWELHRMTLPDGQYGVICYYFDSTKLREAEAALREKEERLRLALEAGALGVWDLDLKTDAAIRSLRHDQIFGYREAQAEWSLEIAMQHVLPEDRPAILEAYAHAAKTGELAHQSRIRWPDGSIHWIDARGRMHLDSEGRPARIAGIVADITEQKKAQEERERLLHEVSVHAAQLQEANERLAGVNEELAASNEELRATTEELQSEIEDRKQAERAIRKQAALIDLSPDAILVRQVDGTIAFWSRGAESLYGWTRQEALGQLSHILLKTQFPQPLPQIVDQVEETGSWSGELIHLGKDGRQVIVQSRWQIRPDGRDGQREILESNVDITERKRTEGTLRQSEQKFAAIFDHSPLPVALIKVPEGILVEVNEAWERFFECSRQEAVGNTPNELGFVSDPENRDRLYADLQSRGSVHNWEMSYRTRSGKDRVGIFNYDRIEIDGQMYHLGTGTDITAIKKAEETLRELNTTLEVKVAQRTAQLERRARQLQKLALELSQAEERERRRIAVILHEDLQQQIAGAKFHLTLVRNRVKDDRQRTDVEHVDELLKEAIEKSRSLSRDLSPTVLHMNDLAEALGWLAGRVQTQQGLTAHLEIRGDMVLLSEALAMFLFRAAQEMLFNVVKHAGVRDVTVRVRRIGRYVSLSVIDRGRGFDTQELNDTSGLGLLSIRERVELLGGRLKIKSVRGQGSTLRIVVPDGPEAKDREEKVQVALSRPTAVSAAPARGLLRVLLVDDHAMMRQGLGMVLQETPDIVVVGEAASGREAINRVNELRPDVVIMDVAMPEMSGEEATRQIKTHLPKTRVIALSMFDEPEKMEMMNQAGAEGYILKTVSAEDLIAAIRGREPQS